MPDGRGGSHVLPRGNGGSVVRSGHRLLVVLVLVLALPAIGAVLAMPAVAAPGYVSDPPAVTTQTAERTWRSLKDLDSPEWGYVPGGRGDILYGGEDALYTAFSFPATRTPVVRAQMQLRGALDDHDGDPWGWATPTPYSVDVWLNGALVATSCPWPHGVPYGGSFVNLSVWSIDVDPALVQEDNPVRVRLNMAPAQGGDWIVIDWIALEAEHDSELPLNASPIADAGPDRLLQLNEVASFDASASHDPDGQIVDYRWDFGDEATATSRYVTHAYAIPGEYRVLLTVRDDGGAQATDDASVTVNAPPVAVAGPDFTVGRDELAEFDGTESYDPDGEIVASSWDFGGGGVVDGPTAAQFFTDRGATVVTLTVTDDRGGSSNDTVAVVVDGAAPRGTVVDNAPPYNAYVLYGGTSSSLDAQRARWWLNKYPRSLAARFKSGWSGKDSAPNHNDLSTYADDLVKARVLWYSGHGLHDGVIPFFYRDTASPTGFSPVMRASGGRSVADWIRFDAGPCFPYYDANLVVEDPPLPERNCPWEVGAEWPGAGIRSRTVSRWNHNVRHVFFFNCSQLNHDNVRLTEKTPNPDEYVPRSDEDPKFFKSWWPSAAVGWARALLGYPNRAHEICGYRYRCPGDGTDVDVVNSFFRYHDGTSRTPAMNILTSWRRANQAVEAWNWAVVIHGASQADFLPGYGRERPPPKGTVDIRYWYQKKVAPSTLGQFDLTISRRPPQYNPFVVTPAYAATVTAMQIAGTVFRFLGPVPESEPRLPAFVGEAAAVDSTALAQYGGDRGAPHVTTDNAGMSTLEASGALVHRFRSGGVRAAYGTDPMKPMREDSRTAFRLAAGFVARHGGIPADASPAPDVWQVARERLSSDLQDFVEPETMAYVFRWSRSLDGYPVRGPGGDRIHAVIDTGGIRDVARLWRGVRRQEESARPLLPLKEALKELARRRDLPKELTLASVRAGYYAPSFLDGPTVAYRSCWILDSDEWGELVLDGETGRLVDGDRPESME